MVWLVYFSLVRSGLVWIALVWYNLICIGRTVERLHCKRPIPICRLFFKVDLLTDIAALCLTDFIDWRYIYSLAGIFDPACELLSPWTKELYLCTVAPLSSLWPPPSLPKLNVLFIQTVSVWEGGGWGVNSAVETIFCRNFTLCFWPDAEPTKLHHHPKQNDQWKRHKGVGVFKVPSSMGIGLFCSTFGGWVAKLGRWVAKLGRWVAKLGKWVAKLGRWVAKLEGDGWLCRLGRWLTKLVERHSFVEDFYVKYRNWPTTRFWTSATKSDILIRLGG